MKPKAFGILLLSIFLCSSALGAYTYTADSADFQTQYNEGDFVSGTINMSFSDEPISSVFTSNYEGSITLLDLLVANTYDEFTEFNCSIQGCGIGLSPDGPATGINLDDGDHYIGFSVSGGSVGVTSASYTLTTNAPNQCNPQISIDVLDLGEVEITNTNYLDQTCDTPDYGCFDSTVQLDDATIPSSQPYCERITLPAAPAFRIGARVTNGSSTTPLNMELYKADGTTIGSCTLPAHSQQVEALSCIVEYASLTQEDYHVCIIAESQPADYTIRSEAAGTSCGNLNPQSTQYTRDYEIFGQSLMFGPVNLVLNDSTFATLAPQFNGLTLGEYLDNYIQTEYDGDCSPSCILPFRLSGTSTTGGASSASIGYQDFGAVLSSSQIFNLATQESTITSFELPIDITPAEFKIPLGASEDFTLTFDDDALFTLGFNLTESFDFTITPLFTGFAQETQFSIVEPMDITSVTWDFGDDTATTTTSANTTTHQYTQQGTFEVTVQITRGDGAIATKTFSVVVGSAQQVAEALIATYQERLQQVSNTLQTYPQWIRTNLATTLMITQFETALEQKEIEYAAATTDEEFEFIVIDLLLFEIPQSIRTGVTASVPLIVSIPNIDTDYIQEISDTSLDDDEQIRTRISSFMINNLNAQLETKQYIVTRGDGSEEVLLSSFKMSTNPQDVYPESYFIIGYARSGLVFAQNYAPEDLSGGTSIELANEHSGNNEFVEFAVIDDVTFEEIGAYISPHIDQLFAGPGFAVCNLNNVCEVSRGEDWENCRSDCPRWIAFWVWLGIILAAALIVYIILQEWYKRHYEHALFPDENDLYNMINFIYNARRSGMTDDVISKKLKQADWSGERIRYVMHKINGKRTGMYEIPLFKFLENHKVHKEIEKRQGGKPVDKRFIKRAHF